MAAQRRTINYILLRSYFLRLCRYNIIRSACTMHYARIFLTAKSMLTRRTNGRRRHMINCRGVCTSYTRCAAITRCIFPRWRKNNVIYYSCPRESNEDKSPRTTCILYEILNYSAIRETRKFTSPADDERNRSRVQYYVSNNILLYYDIVTTSRMHTYILCIYIRIYRAAVTL